MAGGEIAFGVAVRELSVDSDRYLAELARRGMEVTRRVRDLTAGLASKSPRRAKRTGPRRR
jgi:hypothetical protein